VPPTRRERMRDATLQEIKDAAREHLRAHGPAGISLRGIARDIGMTAPALYRYFESLDDLLAAMIETYTDEMCDALEAARDALPEGDLGGRLLAVTRAFRHWALEHRPEFTMMFGAPVPGHPATGHEGMDKPVGRLGALFFDLYFGLWRQRPFPLPPEEDIPPALAGQLRVFAAACTPDDVEAPLGVIRLFAASWVRLYGLVAIEVFGHMHFLLDDGEPLFEAELTDLGRTVGLKKDHF
jgi:AcrR family transcriptional regulator